VDAELSVYLQADVISRAESPTEWWAAKYPLLAAEAKRYLSAPPTSVASEHVFSAAGRIYTDKRLLPKRWKKIEQRSRKKSRFRFLAKIEIFDFEFGNRPSLHLNQYIVTYLLFNYLVCAEQSSLTSDLGTS